MRNGELAPRAPALSQALLSGCLVRVPVQRRRLERWLARLGPLCLAPAGRAERLHPVHFELWLVREGEVRIGGLDQHDFWATAGTAGGAMMGGTMAAWFGSVAPWGLGAARSWSATVARGMARGRSMGAEFGRSWSRTAAETLGTYQECLVTIPGVRLPGARVDHAFVCGMYTDSAVARFADRAFGFGYDKRPGRFRHEEPGNWSVSDRRGTVLSLRVDQGSCEPIGRRELSELEATLQLPLLGLTSRGQFARSELSRSFGSARDVEPMRGTLELRPHLLPVAPRRCRISACGSPGGASAIAFSRMSAVVSFPRAVT